MAGNTSAINLRVEADLKTLVSDRASESGLNLTDYVVKALRSFAAGDYKPWADHPCPDGQRIVMKANDIFDKDRALLDQLLELPKVHDRDLRLTVPVGLGISGTELSTFISWSELRRDYIGAIDRGLQVKRLYIHPQIEDMKFDQLKEIKDFYSKEKDLLGSKAREENLDIRHVAVDEVMSSPGLRSDREYLNDFNVYGSFAVSFTVETSYGIPYRCVVSKFDKDIAYWTGRFDELFEYGKDVDFSSMLEEIEKKMRDVETEQQRGR